MIASVGTHNGPAGGAFLPVLQGAQLWVKWINDRGGLDGHPVRLVVWDDGGDPARHRAQVQEAIERRGAVAFLANTESITGRSSVDYVTAKRVPVIGSEMGADWFYQSEMYFPQGSTADANWYGMVAATAGLEVPRGHTRTAVLACAESPACETLSSAVQNYGPGLGLDPVYTAKTSLAQPDFTAECLNARRLNADIVFLAMDASAISRVAASCSRQDYRPVYASTSAAVTDRLKTDPSLDGMVANSPVFPYFQSGTPASDEFQTAIRHGGSDLTPGLALTAGWVAGKLLEKAAARLGEPPTPDAVLRGLWSLQGETLGGITQPLTFAAGRPATPQACWFTVTVADRVWVSPDGFTRHCRNDPRP